VGVFHEKLDLVDPLFHDPGKDGIENLHEIRNAKNNGCRMITKTPAPGDPKWRSAA
jgi:hypothetical protein